MASKNQKEPAPEATIKEPPAESLESLKEAAEKGGASTSYTPDGALRVDH
ncbi:MAG: hypothetical protein GXC94_02125 [Comamonadaceae bacterium]|jgi:hypothetical protein|nr:hypothetical protein [Comamonadaceae bacterium]